MYAAKIENGAVTQVIVGDASWAAGNLGGEWLASEVKLGVGWLVVDGQVVPPQVEESNWEDFEMES
jgi:hypothetical protein